jgi:hypothetical protein
MGLKFADGKAHYHSTVPWIGGQITVETALCRCVVDLPEQKIQGLVKVCKSMLEGRGMAPMEDVRRLAGQTSWIGGLVPQIRPFARQLWGSLSKTVPTRTGKRLIYIRQIRPALVWMKLLAEGYEGGLSRAHSVQDRQAWGRYFEFDASPWGGGGVLWTKDDPVPSEYFYVVWTPEWEARVQAQIGNPGSQGVWEATAALIAVKLWVQPEVKGPIRIAGDAEGVLADLVQLRGKAPAVNEVAKEVALHLAPQGRDLAGLHIWGENNALSDQLSRVAEKQWTPQLTWLQQVAVERVVPNFDLMNLRFLVGTQ